MKRNSNKPLKLKMTGGLHTPLPPGSGRAIIDEARANVRRAHLFCGCIEIKYSYCIYKENLSSIIDFWIFEVHVHPEANVASSPGDWRRSDT